MGALYWRASGLNLLPSTFLMWSFLLIKFGKIERFLIQELDV